MVGGSIRGGAAMRGMRLRRVLPLAVVALGVASTEMLHAQQAGGIKRTMLQKADLVDIAGREGVLGIAEIPAGGAAGRHAHPGTEIGYVLEGSAILEVDGEPARGMKAGDSSAIEAG